jgi:dual specificity protein kinase YAK1
MAKLEKQPGNRYFRRTKLADIVTLHGQNCSKDDKELLGLFVHFLYGKHGRDHVLVVS